MSKVRCPDIVCSYVCLAGGVMQLRNVEQRMICACQMEGVRLAAESSMRQLEAEVASLKRDAAQSAASRRAADASWQAQVHSHRTEVSLTRAHGRQQTARCLT